MMRSGPARRRSLTSFWRRADGSATAEFAILFPLMISFLMMGAEAGFVSLQRIALERAMDLAARDVRLGALPSGTTQQEFRERVCNRSIMLADCNNRLLLEMRSIDTQTWTLPPNDTACINLAENITPATPFTVGAGESVMYLRACYLVRPIFPTTRLGLQLPLDAAGMFAIRATTGFVNE